MKKLFDTDLTFTEEGIEIADEFGGLIDRFIEENALEEFNPIELSWMLTQELELRLQNMYLDAVDITLEED